MSACTKAAMWLLFLSLALQNGEVAPCETAETSLTTCSSVLLVFTTVLAINIVILAMPLKVEAVVERVTKGNKVRAKVKVKAAGEEEKGVKEDRRTEATVELKRTQAQSQKRVTRQREIFRSIMSTCTMTAMGFVLIALLTAPVICSSTVMCARKFYPIDNACKKCPSHCVSCTNDTHCTLCQIGYYGQICQNPCETGCTGTCHKFYGHCTYACPDGEYPDEHSPACLKCSNHCRVCRSLTSCVECNPGYFGNTCGTRCSELCKDGFCYSNNGTCFDCKNGFYKAYRDCIVCPDGCAQCNDSHTCSICNDGFIGPINGRCFLECPAINYDEKDYVCQRGLCQNVSRYWKFPSNECHQALSSASDCFTEGVCVILKSRLINLQRSSNDDLNYIIIYLTFKCSLECAEHVTGNVTEPCDGHVCKGVCILEKPAFNKIYAIANTIRSDEQLKETWVKSHCTAVTKTDTTDTCMTPNNTVMVVLLIVSCIVIVLLITLIAFRKRCCILLPEITQTGLLTMKKTFRKAQSKKDRFSDPETLRVDADTVSEDEDVCELNVEIGHRTPPEYAEEAPFINNITRRRNSV